MTYNYVSSEPIIADFFAKTKITDSNYADDLLEWLSQGMGLLKIRKMTVPRVCVIQVSHNIGKLPCGMVLLDGYYYNGRRLRKGTGVIDTRENKHKTAIVSDYDSYFVHDPTDEGYINNEQDYRLIRGLDIKAAECTDSSEFYIPFPNYIQTSFEEGCVVCFYRKMPVDKEGYPLIPDQEHIKQALFWWLMAQVTLSGFKHADPKMDYDYCESKFNYYGSKGKRKVSMQNDDDKQAMLELNINLIPAYPNNYYERFFVGGEQPKSIQL